MDKYWSSNVCINWQEHQEQIVDTELCMWENCNQHETKTCKDKGTQ